MKAWPVLAIAFLEAVLLFAHWLIFRTVVLFFKGDLSPTATLILRDALFALALSFVVAALLGFRFSSLPVRWFYLIAATWLGLFDFFFLASCLCWILSFALRMLGLPAHRELIAAVFYSLAVLTGIYGILNARSIRIRRVPIHLPNLPAAWRGRTALLFSDLHLGHINRLGFIRRVTSTAANLNPDIILIPGDVFDGMPVDADRMAAPFKDLAPPFGIFFSSGNHDEFGDPAHYRAALTQAGVRVLSNEKITIDGLQILGVPYHDSTYPARIKAALGALHLAEDQPSILLSHVPNRLPIAEQAGVSLQLSGHTHGGQVFPFTVIVRRVFGKFTYGLQRFGRLQVYTTSGAGTWGPPMRVGTRPEMVLFTFE